MTRGNSTPNRALQVAGGTQNAGWIYWPVTHRDLTNEPKTDGLS